jgi:hypothetical protein
MNNMVINIITIISIINTNKSKMRIANLDVC